jgi:GntR family transcriptional repressor for pyruvate dehydrogenase complex
VFYNRQVMFRQRITRGMLLDQHRAINDAVQARDGAAARAAVERHLDYVRDSLAEWRTFEKNEEIAKQRFDHETAKG